MADQHHDDWFKHTPAEGEPQQEHGEINAPLIMGFLAVVILSVVLVFVTVGTFFFQTIDARVGDSTSSSRIGDENRVQHEAWDADLSSVGWVDEENNVARIPIDAAMQQIVERYQRGEQLTDYPPQQTQSQGNGGGSGDSGSGEAQNAANPMNN